MFESRDFIGVARHTEILAPVNHRGIIHPLDMWSILKLAFWILILVLALSFFGISIQAIITSPAGQANFAYIANLLSQFWHWFSTVLKLP